QLLEQPLHFSSGHRNGPPFTSWDYYTKARADADIRPCTPQEGKGGDQRADASPPARSRPTRTALDDLMWLPLPVIASPQAACAAARMHEFASHGSAVPAVLAGTSRVFGVGAGPVGAHTGGEVALGSPCIACGRPGRARRHSHMSQ